MIKAPEGRSKIMERVRPENMKTRLKAKDRNITPRRLLAIPIEIEVGIERRAITRIIPTALIRSITDTPTRERNRK